MAKEEAKSFLIDISYKLGNMAVEYLTEKDGEKMREAIETLEQRWIPVSERLPEDFGTYLITLENGDVCKCEFNPDYIDEEHDKGAFTYYHDYFDNYTLALIDSEEIAVDAIAWMPFEPYRESEE